MAQPEKLVYDQGYAKYARDYNKQALEKDPNANTLCEICGLPLRANIFKGLPYGSDNCKKVWEAANGRYDPSRISGSV